MNSTNPASSIPARQRWMSVMAKADWTDLKSAWDHCGHQPAFSLLRKPETGLVMVEGRMGGTGAPFNLGEMTVTRCSVALDNGFTGHAYVMGRNQQHAELAAICDALMQDPTHHDQLEQTIIAPLAEHHTAGKRQASTKAAATKVDFFTLVRGEDE